MINKPSRSKIRVKRHRRLRNKISGTAATPRLCVFRSSKHMYAQIIDDATGTTLVSASTLEKAVATGLKSTSNKEAATAVGKTVGERAKAKGIESVVFDRSGYIYHGKVASLADAAREAGLQF